MSLITDTNIPKNIYICFKHKRLPPKVIANWEKLNPDFNVFLFDDNDCIRFLTEYYGQKFAFIFNYIPDGAIKSDFWRVCVLYKMGGVYADADIEPLIPISQFVQPGIHMLTCHSILSPNMAKDSLNPHFIISEAESPILKDCIDEYVKKFVNDDLYDYWKWSITSIMPYVINTLTTEGALESKSAEIITNQDLKLQFLQEVCPDTIDVGSSFLAGCHYNEVQILKNRYEDYKYWNTRSEAEEKRRHGGINTISNLKPLRRVDSKKLRFNSLRQF